LVLRFGSASSNGAASKTNIDNNTHKKRMVGITLMSPLIEPILFAAGCFPAVLCRRRKPLLSRFAPREGLVTFRQRFVRRCQWWQIAPAGRLNEEQ
jgi:hypothetical protein